MNNHQEIFPNTRSGGCGETVKYAYLENLTNNPVTVEQSEEDNPTVSNSNNIQFHESTKIVFLANKIRIFIRDKNVEYCPIKRIFNFYNECNFMGFDASKHNGSLPELEEFLLLHGSVFTKCPSRPFYKTVSEKEVTKYCKVLNTSIPPDFSAQENLENNAILYFVNQLRSYMKEKSYFKVKLDYLFTIYYSAPSVITNHLKKKYGNQMTLLKFLGEHSTLFQKYGGGFIKIPAKQQIDKYLQDLELSDQNSNFSRPVDQPVKGESRSGRESQTIEKLIDLEVEISGSTSSGFSAHPADGFVEANYSISANLVKLFSKSIDNQDIVTSKVNCSQTTSSGRILSFSLME